MRKKIIVSVISDLVTDQRVQKECNTLYEIGYEILLIGRKSKRNFLLKDLPYRTIRFYNPFSGSPLMYLIFNVQLFFYLLFKRSDILWSNDLDTLLPNFLVSRIKKVKLVYDSHEYFTESVYKKSSKRVWENLEKKLFPRLKNVITVNKSIKEAYETKYGIPITVVRNVPYTLVEDPGIIKPAVPVTKKILVMQGIGLNENRGAEEAVLMMQYLPNEFMLYFIGSGTILSRLKMMVAELKLGSRITFIDVLPYKQMMEYTKQCFLGLIFEKIEISDEHLFALPNKFFDYIHAGIPVLSSEAVEIKAIIEKYQIGDIIQNFDPESMAGKIMDISKNTEMYTFWKRNTTFAASELNWEKEKELIIQFMTNLS